MSLVEKYKRDGYVVLRDAVRIDAAQSAVYQHLNYVPSTDPINEFRKHARIASRRIELMQLFYSGRLLEFVSRLGIQQPIMQTSPTLHAMGFDENFEGTKAHQDWPALQSGLNTVVAWIPLHEVDANNYPLEIAAGSHKAGLLPAKVTEHYSETEGEFEFKAVPVKRNEVLIFSVFTVHRTKTPGVGIRLAVSHRFEDAADAWYAKNPYSAQKRVIERDVRRAPALEKVREVFA